MQVIMKKVIRHKSLLKVLHNTNSKLRKAILKNCDNDVICVLTEIIVNLLNGNIQLTASQKTKLKRYKNAFRKIANLCKNNKLSNKKSARKLFIQNGGAFPFFLLPLIGKAALGGAVGAAAGYAVKKAINAATNKN